MTSLRLVSAYRREIEQRGIGAVADRLTCALVARWQNVDALPEGWQRVQLDNAAQRAAA